MGTYKLIGSFSINNLNTAEKLHLMARLWEIAQTIKGSAGDDQEPGEGAIEVLHFTPEQIEELQEIVAKLRSLVYETKSSAETPEMDGVDEERCRVVNVMVSRSLNYEDLALATERDAGKLLANGLRPYHRFQDRPLRQRTEIIDGFLEDISKPEYAEAVTTMGFAPYIAEAERLNNQYRQLEAERSLKASIDRQKETATEVGDKAQNLLDDLCALANASSLLYPSAEATSFVAQIINLFAETRTARNQRGDTKPVEGQDENKPNDTENPADEENPDTEQPSTETPGTEPPGEGTGEEETPNPDGQQPTEPQPGVDSDGDGSPEVV